MIIIRIWFEATTTLATLSQLSVILIVLGCFFPTAGYSYANYNTALPVSGDCVMGFEQNVFYLGIYTVLVFLELGS